MPKLRKLRLSGFITSYPFSSNSITAANLKKELDKFQENDSLEITLTSSGGSVFEGIAVADMINSWKGDVKVIMSGVVASAATMIPLVSDEKIITDNTLFMIHDPSTITWGNIKDHEKSIEIMNKIKDNMVGLYESHSTMDEAKVRTAMTEETWYSAKEAVKVGFADSIMTRRLSKEEKQAQADAKQLYGDGGNMPTITDEQLAEYEGLKTSIKQVENLSSMVIDLKKEIIDLKKIGNDDRVDKVLNEAISDGRIKPVEKDQYKALLEVNFDMTKNLIDKLAKDPRAKTIGEVKDDPGNMSPAEVNAALEKMYAGEPAEKDPPAKE